MELKNFGSIMGFAAELEAADKAFYESAATNPVCAEFKDLLEAFAKDEKKNEKNMLRARREHVTEMVLEPIERSTGDPPHGPGTDHCSGVGAGGEGPTLL
jgi:hypothetical protein